MIRVRVRARVRDRVGARGEGRVQARIPYYPGPWLRTHHFAHVLEAEVVPQLGVALVSIWVKLVSARD